MAQSTMVSMAPPRQALSLQSSTRVFMPASDRTVFLVDDESVIAQSLAMILNSAGFKAAFDRPEKALAAAQESAPQLLITDVVMPGMTGVELAIQFRAKYPDCKVLLFSGQASTADLLDQARKQGHDFDLLLKPVHPADLLAIQRMPFITDRRLFQGRPRPSRRFIGSGISGPRLSHCSSVKSRDWCMRVLMTCSAPGVGPFFELLLAWSAT
jgi:CheY-like chemotaxis protein